MASDAPWRTPRATRRCLRKWLAVRYRIALALGRGPYIAVAERSKPGANRQCRTRVRPGDRGSPRGPHWTEDCIEGRTRAHEIRAAAALVWLIVSLRGADPLQWW